MNVMIQVKPAPTLDFVTVASVLGIDCPDGLPGGSPISGADGIEWSLPGAQPLTAVQLAGLQLLTEYMVTGTERFPGLIQDIIDAGSYVAGKRAFLKRQVDSGSIGDPVAAMIYLVSTITVDAENFGRSMPGVAATQTPTITEVMEYAKQLIDAGAVD